MCNVDKNFLYCLNYQATLENLDLLSDFLDNNKVYLAWKVPDSNMWLVSGKKPYAKFYYNFIRQTLGYEGKINLYEFAKPYFFLKSLLEYAIENNLQDIIFLHSYIFNLELELLFSGISYIFGKLVIGCSVYFPRFIVNFIDFCETLSLDFAYNIDEPYLRKKVEAIVEYYKAKL